METIKLRGHDNPFVIAHIQYVTSSGSYSILHTTTGPFLISLGMGVLHSLIPALMRVHQRHLINPDYLRSHSFRADGRGTLTLKTGQKLPVSRRYRLLFITPAPLVKPVINLTTGTYFPSMVRAATAIGVSPSTLTPVLQGKQARSRQHQFRYATPAETAAGQMLHP